MQHTRTFSLVVMVLVFLGALQAQAQTVIKDPVKYNDFIVEQQNKIGAQVVRFNELVSADENLEDREGIDAHLKYMGTVTDQSIAALQALKTHEKDLGLKASAITLFQFYKRIFEKEYAEMIGQLYSEQPDMARLQEILETVSAEEKGFDEDFQSKQEAFAKQHGFSLAPNEMQDEIDEGE